MFLDACRDGASPSASEGNRPKSKLPPAMQQPAGSSGLRVLYSTSPGKRSYEDDALRHGIFTTFLIDGINGEAAGPNGLVTFLTIVLKGLGFDVTERNDHTSADFTASIKDFAKSLGPEDIGLFYYSGSGGLCDGLPVMVPSDISPGEEAIKSRGPRVPVPRCGNTIPASVVVTALSPEGHKGPVLAVFDMCLTHIDQVQIQPSELAQDNAYYLFSTQPGENAFEDKDGGYFTQRLVQVLGAPGASTASLLFKVGLKPKDTHGNRYPYELNGLSEPFYFSPTL